MRVPDRKQKTEICLCAGHRIAAGMGIRLLSRRPEADVPVFFHARKTAEWPARKWKGEDAAVRLLKGYSV